MNQTFSHADRERMLEKATLCLGAITAALNLWGTEVPSPKFLEDMALLLVHSRDETFLDDLWAEIQVLQGMSYYEAEQHVNFRLHGKDYDNVSSVWTRLSKEGP